jgi:hypothetical protein
LRARFHEGCLASLDSAVWMMAPHPRGVDLSQFERQLIIPWLKTSTGDIPQDYVAGRTTFMATR